jgi:hypothetical protein
VDHPHLQILVLKFEEMAKGSTPFLLTEMMATQIAMMDEALLAQ